ncbi:unnamed protein product [Merluccius merluccius]
MKLKRGTVLSCMDFNSVYCLFSVRNAHILAIYFRLLDCHNNNALNDVQFYHFMRHATDLPEDEVMAVFEMLDWDASGEIGFEEFYMIVCILLCHEFHVEKNFIFRHSRAVFQLLDADGSGEISPAEFQASVFLFNLPKHALTELFDEYDFSGDENLDYKEFKMFTVACIDMQQETNEKSEDEDEDSCDDTLGVVVET